MRAYSILKLEYSYAGLSKLAEDHPDENMKAPKAVLVL
jgi:hypothetical protein